MRPKIRRPQHYSCAFCGKAYVLFMPKERHQRKCLLKQQAKQQKAKP